LSNIAKPVTKSLIFGTWAKTLLATIRSAHFPWSRNFLAFLLEAKYQGKTVVGYGAAAKANTLMNYAGIRPDLIPFVVDRNPAKQGKFMPGSRIPIVDESYIQKTKPDYVIVFPWNLKQEILAQLEYIRDWGGSFVTAIPQLEVL